MRSAGTNMLQFSATYCRVYLPYGKATKTYSLRMSPVFSASQRWASRILSREIRWHQSPQHSSHIGSKRLFFRGWELINITIKSFHTLNEWMVLGFSCNRLKHEAIRSIREPWRLNNSGQTSGALGSHHVAEI